MSVHQAPDEEIRRPGLGLALSGGGFRASFFHVGVLARLAETGTLRRVEVISTVSGGSILGALYYLALKDLLENVPDAEISDAHYVQVVRRVERVLFDGVAGHIRARAYADLGKNVRMRRADYSRSDRLGELYDEIFYRPVWNESLFGGPPTGRETPIELRELLVHPPGEGPDFRPLRHNDRRTNCVPVLLLNATALNTGHNWRFQAVEMGEDPRSRDDWVQVDKNERLLSSRYEQIAPHQQDFPLGAAVAASACVPALFHPLAVSGLFPGVRVELVDGGVHDNQGVGALLDLDCVRMIVSDASGQMGDLPEPSTRIPAAAGRASSIYGDRVREEQLIESLSRESTVLVHLRKGLPALGISPLGTDGKPLAETTKLGTIDYGVQPQVQSLLARVRTDLDAFSQVEAYALSLDAYLMASRELPEPAVVAYEWVPDAAEVATLRTQLGDPGAGLLTQLGVAAKRFRKASALDGTMKAIELVSALVALVVLGLLAYGVYEVVPDEVPTWSLLVAIVVPAVLVALYLRQKFPLKLVYRLSDWLYTSLLPAVAAPLLWVGARISLWATPRFLAAGRIAKLPAKDTT